MIFILYNVTQKEVNAFEYDNNYYNMLTVNDLKDLKIEFYQVVNRTYSGSYYKVGIMGHKRYVELGQFISFKYVVLTESSNYFTGSLLGIQQIQTQEFSVSKTTTVSASVAVGFVQIVNAAINLANVGSVGKSNELSVQVSFAGSISYATTTMTSNTTMVTYDLNQVIPSYEKFKVGQVALVAEFNINKSYTKEDRGFLGWKVLENTKRENYSAYLFLDTITTFIYDDSFGTVNSGSYALGIIALN